MKDQSERPGPATKEPQTRQESPGTLSQESKAGTPTVGPGLPINPRARPPGSPLLRVLENPVGLLLAALVVLGLLGLLANLSRYAPSHAVSPPSGRVQYGQTPPGRSRPLRHLTGSEQLDPPE